MSRERKSLDKHWYLAIDDSEVSFTEFEFSLIRIASAFDRWQRDCMACCVDGHSGTDAQLLCVIGMHERAKSISDIARLVNRDDSSNLAYNIRKLQGSGLIEKVGSSKRGVAYQITEQGREIIVAYAQYRRELLLDVMESLEDLSPKLEQTSKLLNLISGIYDQASCIAASHRV